jgi:hypothetical protein
MGLVGTIVADYAFYRGQLTARYFVLTELSSAVVLTAAGIALGAYLVRHSGRSLERFWVMVPVFLGAIAFFQVVNPVTNLRLLHARSEEVRESTSAWDDHVSAVHAMVADGDYQQVVLYVTSTYSFELAASTVRFLSFRSDADLRFFLVADLGTPVDPRLADLLLGFSRNGNTDWPLEPLTQLNADAPVFCLVDTPTTSQDLDLDLDLCDGVADLLAVDLALVL